MEKFPVIFKWPIVPIVAVKLRTAVGCNLLIWLKTSDFSLFNKQKKNTSDRERELMPADGQQLIIKCKSFSD